MAKTLEDIQKIISEMGIEMIDFKLTDIDGRWRHLSIPAERLSESTMQQGIGFDGSNYGYAPVENSDMVFIPVLDSAVVDRYCGVPTLSMIGDVKVIALPDALSIYQGEVLRYIFAINKVDHEFAISFDVDVINVYEAYDRIERVAWEKENAKTEDAFAYEKRVYILSQLDNKMPSVMPYQVPFRQLTTLLQTYSGNVDKVIASLGNVKKEQEDALRRRCSCAWTWVTEYAPDEFKFSLVLDGSKIDLTDSELKVLQQIKTDVTPLVDTSDEQTISQKIYDVAVGNNIKPKELFNIMYRVLVRKTQGPRLASFMKIIGREALEKILDAY